MPYENNCLFINQKYRHFDAFDLYFVIPYNSQIFLIPTERRSKPQKTAGFASNYRIVFLHNWRKVTKKVRIK